MADVETLKALRERVRAASGPDRELDSAIGLALGWFPKNRDHYEWIEADGSFIQPLDPKPLTGSVDAALALVEHCLPGWDWQIHGGASTRLPHANLEGDIGRAFYARDGFGATAALAIIAAALSALIAEAESASLTAAEPAKGAPNGP